ncbi:nonstructural protein [Sigmofec virus UA08Rod_5936]|uniref:Nonstructural protein n=1 Tax=Sigmofec virus UA08Rod_5936 TaxID=2929447 RepID=A0A976N161_9VIRU|nr:nonstructural protein [Sigmofec virus UA08Rod_5936]
MIYGLYAVRDVKTGFMTPTMDVNDQTAVRNFFHAVRNSEGILFSYAQDFDLYHIADFDSDSGAVTPLVPVVFVAHGSDALAELNKE